MKLLLIIPFLVSVLFASGGDTLKYSTSVNDLSDGDVFYAEQHWKSLKDSIRSIINGRLGNKNLAADAKISLSKLDTVGTITADGGFKGIADSASGSSRLGGTLTKAGLEDSLSRKAPRCSVAVNTLVKSLHATSGKQGNSIISDDGTNASVNGGIIGIGSNFSLITNTLDGSDNKFIAIYGGGGTATNRGAAITVSGNEQSLPGVIQLIAGLGNGTSAGKILLSGGKGGIGTTTPDSLWAVAGGISATGGARIDGPLSAATINTGYGATEVPLYTPPTTFQCSLYESTTYKAVVTATYSRHGNVVSVHIPTVFGNMTTGSGDLILKGFPTTIRGTSKICIATILNINAGGAVIGILIIPPNGSDDPNLFGSTFATGVCGVSESSFCYPIF